MHLSDREISLNNDQNIEKVFLKVSYSRHLNSEINLKLLKYLIDAELEGKSIKEADIASDLFGRDKNNFDSTQDSIVRSHMHSLRKQLNKYYLVDGINDAIKFILPKGSYRVELLEDDKHNPSIETNKKRIKILSYSSIAFSIILIFISVFFYQKYSSLQSKTENTLSEINPVWHDFVASDIPTILVVGNFFVFKEIDEVSNRKRIIRDNKINSAEELSDFISEYPEIEKRQLNTSNSYLGVEAPFITSFICRQFGKADKEINVKLASELSWQDLQNNNIIYVGNIKSLYKMKYYFNYLRFKYSLFPHTIYFTPTLKDTLEKIAVMGGGGDFHDDYAIVAKFPGSYNNTIMLITSFSSFGQVEPLKILTSFNFEEELKKTSFIKDRIPGYFEILFRVEGIDKSGMNTEIVRFMEIKKESFGGKSTNDSIPSLSVTP